MQIYQSTADLERIIVISIKYLYTFPLKKSVSYVQESVPCVAVNCPEHRPNSSSILDWLSAL